MYYKISSNFLQRGWDGIPYALVDRKTKQLIFMRPNEAYVTKMCTGLLDFNSIIFTPEDRILMEKLNKMGVLDKSEQPSSLLPEQKFHLYPVRFIRSAHWSITGRCNYRCKHCYMSAPHAKFGELSHEDCLNIVEQLAECGIFSVSLTGGEALVRNDFMDIVDALLDHDIKIKTVYTNGKLVNEKLLNAFEKRESKPEFNMSFDGIGWHDWLRGVGGAEISVINAFKLCHEHGFPIGAEFCLHRGNKDTLRDSILLLSKLGVKNLKVSPVVDVGEWSAMPADMSLSNEEVYETYLNYLPYYLEDGRPLKLMLGALFLCNGDMTYMIPGCKKIPENCENKFCVCGHARNNMYISADGRVLPCMPLSGYDFFASRFPQIIETPLKYALNNSEYTSCIDTKLSTYLEHNEECRNCKYKLNCASGCRGAAMNAENKDYLAVDKANCLLFKGNYIERLERIMEKGNMKRR